jgi:methylated-DNA-[protein]-cysteine S-methyltransferase
MQGFALFDTEIGRCGIAWGRHGVIAVQLPEASDRETCARLCRRCSDVREAAPPPAVQSAIDGIVTLLRGEAIALDAIALDMSGVPTFDRKVYEVTRTVPPGALLTYGEIAARVGEPEAARAVGQALARNPFPLLVPCHRVHAAGGRAGGFSAGGGVATKLHLLQIEGAHARGTLFDRNRGS